VDACNTTHEIWEAIERLQQGESLNIQDVNTNLFWEFGKFTSHDGESIESYYSRFYKLMNEMIRNNLTVDKMQVNVQFLQQLQPEWSSFEVNELRAKRIAKNANPLALVATAQPYQDPYYQTSKSHKSSAQTSKASLLTRSHATTRHKGKETAKPITPPSESAFEEDSDPEQAQKDKEYIDSVQFYLVQGNITINRVYYVEGLNHNLFSVGQFCDADLEVAFQKSTCFVRDLQKNDLLTGNRGSDLYTISLQETTSSTLICLMAKASPTQAWLWHRRLSHLNFNYINLLSKKDVVIGLPKLKYVKNQLCSSCEVSKAKRISFKTKTVPSLKGRLNLLHMDLCGPMRVASINGKKYILVIVDDYSRYTWTLFLRSKDETPEVLKDFLTMIQRNLQAPVIFVRTDRGTEFLNKTLNAFFKEEGIEHQTSTPRTPEQNGVVERQNRTLVEAARTMLSASKLHVFFWAEAIATACYTQSRSILVPTHEKTAYHLINDRKPSIKHLHIFCCTCYLTRDGENLDKMKEKGDPCILVGYSTQSKGYHVYNKRTRLIVESIHLKFDEIKEMSETFVANDTSGLLGLVFGPLYDQFFNVGASRVNKSSSPTDNSAQQDILTSTNIHPTTEPSTLTHVNAEENNNDQVEFTNPFCIPVREVAESSSRNIGNSNMHTFNQPQDFEYRGTKDHLLTQVRRNPLKPVQTRRQLVTDPEMCMFALTVSTAELKNIKKAMADSTWIEAMQEELHQFDRLQVSEFVDKPLART
ncbi:retrovirus-related pol polyprotein from transposon TNT 1-94, partial [Tanacetum coccineum]